MTDVFAAGTIAPEAGQPVPNGQPGAATKAEREAWALLEQVPDPELPVVSIRELGILREIHEHEGRLQVVITPTYSGCPAMGQIEDDVRAALAAFAMPVTVMTRLAPAWTTDWITPEARDKLRAYGIAPPHSTAATQKVVQLRLRERPAPDTVACPRCGSRNTVETSRFGSTACKALHKCLDCLEPFDYFKPY